GRSAQGISGARGHDGSAMPGRKSIDMPQIASGPRCSPSDDRKPTFLAGCGPRGGTKTGANRPELTAVDRHVRAGNPSFGRLKSTTTPAVAARLGRLTRGSIFTVRGWR